jgi:hypothetical protein
LLRYCFLKHLFPTLSKYLQTASHNHRSVSAQKVWVNSRLYEHSTSGELFFKAFYPDFLSGYIEVVYFIERLQLIVTFRCLQNKFLLSHNFMFWLHKIKHFYLRQLEMHPKNVFKLKTFTTFVLL